MTTIAELAEEVKAYYASHSDPTGAINDYRLLDFKNIDKAPLLDIHGHDGKIAIVSYYPKGGPKALIVKEKMFTRNYDMFLGDDGQWFNIHDGQPMVLDQAAIGLPEGAVFVYAVELDRNTKSNVVMMRLAKHVGAEVIVGRLEDGQKDKKGKILSYNYMFLGRLKLLGVRRIVAPVLDRGEFDIDLLVFGLGA